MFQAPAGFFGGVGGASEKLCVSVCKSVLAGNSCVT